MHEHVVIIGGGQSGIQCAMTLRQKGFIAPITLITREPYLPYQRPPLSKDYLSGELQRDKLFVQGSEYYISKGIDVLCNTEVAHIDRALKSVTLDQGAPITYSKLLISTGASHRKLALPNTDLTGVLYLRDIDESEALRAALDQDGPVVILGAGYIGLEVAATARKKGRKVTIVDIAPHVLGRVGTPPIATFLKQKHEAEGVEFCLGTEIVAIGGGAHVETVELSNGEILECSTLLIGIGALIDTKLAENAGLETDGGILVNSACQSSDPNIYSSGDCTKFYSARYDRLIRLETVPNATGQGRAAAEGMLDEDTRYDPLPWFWSDQYESKYQAVGLTSGYDSYAIRGDQSTGSFSVWFFKANLLIAVEAVNDPKSFAFARRTLTVGQTVDEGRVSNSQVDLKSLIV